MLYTYCRDFGRFDDFVFIKRSLFTVATPPHDDERSEDPFFVWRRRETAVRMVPEGSEEEKKEKKETALSHERMLHGPHQPLWTVCQVQKSKEEMAIISLQARRFRNQTEGSGRLTVCSLQLRKSSASSARLPNGKILHCKKKERKKR